MSTKLQESYVSKNKLTPMFRQYFAAKEAHPDAVLFFRMGDFYEMFFDDAEVVARVLGLRLTSRSKGADGVPMAGFPCHSANTYIAKMVREGHKVAICEQVEDASATNKLVRREVTRVLTPGTVVEDDLLDARKSSFLACLVTDAGSCGLAWVDVSTASFFAETCAADSVPDRLAWIEPAELLLEKDEPHLSLPGLTITKIDAETRGERQQRLSTHFGVPSMRSFGLIDGSPAVLAAAAILRYIEDKFPSALASLTSIQPSSSGGRAVVGVTARRRLELLLTEVERKRKGSLIAVLDRTLTSMGARRLRSWILAPLADHRAIVGRQEAVEEILRDFSLAETLKERLRKMSDFERLSTKVATRRANPRDVISLGSSLAHLAPLARALLGSEALLLVQAAPALGDFEALVADIAATLCDSPPAHLKDGDVIRTGFCRELDELKQIASDGTAAMAGFQASEQDRTGIPSLKVGYNRVFGYYLEVTHAHRDKVPSDWVRKQTLKNAERYITPELKELEDRVLGARESASALEQELFLALRERVAEHVPEILATASVVADLDALTSLATLARDRGYVRPKIVDEPVLEILGGRHPVLESALCAPFVPNDTRLGADHGCMALITGPNMAGKSTYIRQTALLCLMAQIGSFVPAEAATIGIVDQFFTRIGASDELHRGMSTFMVEMSETAAILRNATSHSLVILDEIGRGTSTVDGLSLAWAIAEHIHDKIGCRTLFATHYHELIGMAEACPAIRNYHISVKEWDDEIIFLREIVPGGTDKSYGVNVARLAGMPACVSRRAQEVLASFEGRQLPKPAGRKPRQLSLFADDRELFLRRLSRVRVDELSPRKALEALYELTGEAAQLLGGP